jgi:hypothetical protein
LKGLDSSGNKNHAAVPPVNYGAGVGGKGHAAKFTGGTDYVEIRNHQKYTESGNTFTVELWLYLRQDSTGDWRTVLHKGTTDEERTPIIFLEPLTRGIEFFVSTTDTSQPKGERLWSNSFIPLHKVRGRGRGSVRVRVRASQTRTLTLALTLTLPPTSGCTSLPWPRATRCDSTSTAFSTPRTPRSTPPAHAPTLAPTFTLSLTQPYP